MVARSGPLSIYAALCECCPAAVRMDITGSKYGVSETQFNKCLQAAGFERERDRRGKALNKQEDPVGAGMYLFCMRRWRDPRDATDLEELSHGWKELCALFPVNTADCTLDRFIQLCEKMHDCWKPNAGRAMKRLRLSGPNGASGGARSEASTQAGSPISVDPSVYQGMAAVLASGIVGNGADLAAAVRDSANMDPSTMSTITALLALQQRGDSNGKAVELGASITDEAAHQAPAATGPIGRCTKASGAAGKGGAAAALKGKKAGAAVSAHPPVTTKRFAVWGMRQPKELNEATESEPVLRGPLPGNTPPQPALPTTEGGGQAPQSEAAEAAPSTSASAEESCRSVGPDASEGAILCAEPASGVEVVANQSLKGSQPRQDGCVGLASTVDMNPVALGAGEPSTFGSPQHVGALLAEDVGGA